MKSKMVLVSTFLMSSFFAAGAWAQSCEQIFQDESESPLTIINSNLDSDESTEIYRFEITQCQDMNHAHFNSSHDELTKIEVKTTEKI